MHGPVLCAKPSRRGWRPTGDCSSPQADMAVAERLAGESYAALAGYLAALFFGEDIDAGILQREIGRIYDFQVPLRPVGSRYTLELFHGPTFAFKDFGAGFMGRMVGLLGGADEKLVILTATSGDTGSAVAHGFYNVPGVEVVLLYPEGKISRLQECQMTALGGNIHPLRVGGTFDDCQRLVKELFADSSFRAAHRVSSANSINLLRWIPQAFYYFYGYFRWRQASGGENPVVVVPSGNYGNLSPHGAASRRIRRGVERQRRGARIPADGRLPSAAVGADAGQCDGRRSAEQLRADDVAVRRRCGRPARRIAGVPVRRRHDPPYDRRAVPELRLSIRSAQRRGLCGFRGLRQAGVLPFDGPSGQVRRGHFARDRGEGAAAPAPCGAGEASTGFGADGGGSWDAGRVRRRSVRFAAVPAGVSVPMTGE